MADQDLTHTADIIKAAIPFVDSPLKGTAELFAKLLDLMGSFKSATNSGKLAANGFLNSKIDLEGLLKGIRPICNDNERKTVDQFLNFFNMKRTFEMYNNMMSMMKSMQDVGDFSFADAFGANDTDNVTGNFNGSAFESIFKNFGGFGDSSTNDDSFDSTDTNSETFKAAENKDSDDDPPPGENHQAHNNNSSQEDNSTNSTPSGASNNMMFEMLKNMVPPEQLSTIENLSMLFNTMSYDNNSKSDDSKEQNDG